MSLKLVSVASLVLMVPVFALASGMSPFCRFSTSQDRSIFGGAKYRIADAYNASDLVVTGKAAEESSEGKPQRFKVDRVIKGKDLQNISLVGRRCRGTACEGLFARRDLPVLLLLREMPNGLFHKVDGNGNDACPNVFEIHGDEAYIGDKKVNVTSLKNFFNAHPDPISYP